MQHCRHLDGLRALAVLTVVAFHVGHLQGFAMGGFLGVDVFFVLSAYLISSILLSEVERNGRIDLADFWRRRARRLVPALGLFLAAYVALAPSLFPAMSAAEHARDALVTGLYLSDYGYALFGVPDVLRHSWSLAVEVHFYLFWPFAILVLAKTRRPLVILGVLWVLATIWRGAALETLGWTDAYYRSDTRLSGFMAGAWVAFALRKGPSTIGGAAPWASLGVLVLFFEAAQFGSSRSLAIGTAVADIASAVLVATAVQGKLPRALEAVLGSRPAVGLGKLSYGIYLWHFPIALLLRDSMPLVPALAVTAGLSLILAAVSYVTVEAPFRGPRRRGQHQSVYAGSSGPIV